MPDIPFASPARPARGQTTPLHALHGELGARMTAFAGYAMPLSYPAGILAEHRHCRTAAALFDVSHLGQLRLCGAGAAAALETLVPVDILGLPPGQQRYGFFTDESGGILDDLTITRLTPALGSPADAGDLLLVVNASGKAGDTAHLINRIGGRCAVQPLADQALLALQGPQAEMALGRLHAGVAALALRSAARFVLDGIDCFVTRGGYTGEDGFEISVPAGRAEALARALLAQPEVRPAGLGARDTLRLEAGFCRYGLDISVDTTPVEAGLARTIPAVRRAGGARAGGYPGAARIERQLLNGVSVARCGLIGAERSPVREGTALVDATGAGVGTVCSGGWAPTLDRPIAMAYLPVDCGTAGQQVFAQVRGNLLPMTVSPLPFVPWRHQAR